MARTIRWLLLCLIAGVAVARAQEPPPVAPVASLPPFDTWLADLRSEALSRGIKPEVVEAAFTGIQPVDRILERDRAQAEFTLDLDAYLKRRLTRDTVWLMGAVTPVQGAGLPSLRLHQNVEWAERETIRRALDRSRGVKKDAAELMGISQRALSHYLLKYKDSL